MERPPERRFFVLFTRYWLPVLLYVTMVIAISAQPYLVVPGDFRYGDKIAHIGEYFGLGVLIARALRATMRIPLPLAAALIALSLGIVVGTGDEYLQSFVPGRQSSALDLLADTIGLTLAQLVYLAFTRE
ncbi:MAG TPA: VanZ family protein [Candidatus Eisenbacteria bacterium]